MPCAARVTETVSDRLCLVDLVRQDTLEVSFAGSIEKASHGHDCFSMVGQSSAPETSQTANSFELPPLKGSVP
jgi:hypothetical protein